METLGVSVPSFTQNERPQETYAAPSSSKKRKPSEVWNHFRKVLIGGKVKAVCKRCEKEFDGSSKNGTTHLRQHSSRCLGMTDGETHKKMMSTCLETAGIGGDFGFDNERSRLDVARMIIKHGYPLNMVEHEFFQNFVKNLQPSFKFWSKDNLKADILSVYKSEKEKLYKYLGTLSCHFNLIIQFWTCHSKKNVYCCFALQFLEDGILKKKIIALKKVDQYDDTAAGNLLGTVTSLLQEWNIDKKLYSITLRSSHPNDEMVQKLETWLREQVCQAEPLCGNFFHIYCTTNILNLLFQNGWNEVGGILGKIKNVARYFKDEQLLWELNFDQILKQQYRVQGKYYGVSLRWDSALLVLKKALTLKSLISTDLDFEAPSIDEWDVVRVVDEFLNLLYDDSRLLLRCKCLTANVYFYQICGIHFKLLKLQKSKDQNICSMARKMNMQFEKYFDKCRTVLAIASILDPREKCDYVTFAFKECYGSREYKTYLAAIIDALNNIFDCYAKELSKQTLSSSIATNNGNSFTSYRDCSYYDQLNTSWRKETYCRNKVASRKELDQYLAEPCIDLNGEFDILDWWCTNGQEFPTLRKMALDILRIPMSTDFDFGIGDMTKVIHPAFNGLRSDIIEALICGKDWLDMSIKKAPNKEDEHFFSYTLNGEPTDHDHTLIAMGGPSSSNWKRKLDSVSANMDLMVGNGHQHGTHPHCTPISPRSPRFQVPVSKEPHINLFQPLPRVLTTTNINPTVTVPQETEPNLDIGIGHQHDPHSHCTSITPCFPTSQVPVLQEPLSLPPTWISTAAYNNPIVTVPHETEPNLDIGIGHQHGPHPHCTPTTPRSPTCQVPVPQEPNSQPLADCMLTTTNINPTVTMPQETERNLDIGLRHQHDPSPHCTPSTPHSHTSQVLVTHEYLSPPYWMLTLPNNNPPESSSSGNWNSNIWGHE